MSSPSADPLPLCRFEPIDGGRQRCTVCGTERPIGAGELKRGCTGKRSFQIGDAIAAGLDVLGFQKCQGCEERQAWLNRLGERLAQAFGAE